MKKDTKVTHQPRLDLPATNTALVSPIHQSVKFTFDTFEQLLECFQGKRRGYFYSRVANPTVRELEILLSELQGRERTVCLSSGVAAISHCLLSLLEQGDHIISFLESYRPTRYIIKEILHKFGVSCTFLSISDWEGLERALREKPTKLVFFETPTNPVVQLVDIDKLTGLAQKHGALTLLDNTFAGFHNHGQFPIDIFIHSLTKYASGHGDVMGGAITANADIMKALQHDLIDLGAVLDPHAAFLISRGMKTYAIRYERHCSNALAVAEFLEQQPCVENVRYPGLSSHPQHELARQQMLDFGNIVAFDLKPGAEALPPFINSLQLFELAGSLGSTESLVAPCALFYTEDLSPQECKLVGISEATLRLSVGIESSEDLIADLKQALPQG